MANLEGTRRLAPDLKDVDNRLRSWADWSKRGVSEIGWPAVSLTARMVEWNRIGVRPEGHPPPEEIPAPIAVIDRLVAKLPENQRVVVKINYMRSDPLEVKARLAKMPVGRFRRLLDRSRWSVRYALYVLDA